MDALKPESSMADGKMEKRYLRVTRKEFMALKAIADSHSAMINNDDEFALEARRGALAIGAIAKRNGMDIGRIEEDSESASP